MTAAATRLTLTELAQELNVFRDMGVFFTLSEEEWIVLYDVAPRAEACKAQVRAFRDEHASEIRAYLMTEKDLPTRGRLEFMRWCVERGDWGAFPGMRVLRGIVPKQEKV